MFWIADVLNHTRTPLAHLNNMSIRQGSFPCTWKSFIFKPGDQPTVGKYRAISYFSCSPRWLGNWQQSSWQFTWTWTTLLLNHGHDPILFGSLNRNSRHILCLLWGSSKDTSRPVVLKSLVYWRIEETTWMETWHVLDRADGTLVTMLALSKCVC